MKNPDKMSNAELRREVKELREGKCRLACRSVKEAFYAGFEYALTGEDKGDWFLFLTVDEAYDRWKAKHERP